MVSDCSFLGGVSEAEFLGADHTHDDVEDTELSSGKGTDHDPSGSESDSAESVHTFLSSDVLETGEHTSVTTGSGLVDLGEEGIGGVRDGGGDDTGNNSGLEGDDDVLSTGELIGSDASSLVDGFGGLTLDNELGHGVRDLLAEDGDESRVESVDETVLGHDSLGALTHAVGEIGLRDKSDSAGFVGAEEDIGDALSHGGGGKVDAGSVFPGSLVSHGLDESGLEELDSSELEPSLDEVSLHGGSESGEEGTGTFVGDDVSSSGEEASVGLGVKLDSGLDDINGGDTTVSEGAADTTGEGSLEEVLGSEGALTHD